MRRIILIGLILVVAIAIALAFWSNSKEEASSVAPVTLITRLNSDILGTEPGGSRDENTDTVIMQIGEGLVGLRDDGSVAPLLAESIKVSSDGRQYRFKLRKGVSFHNGAPLTSAEVIWSFERYLSEDSEWRCKSDLSADGLAPISAVKAEGTDTVVVTLAKPAPLFLKILAKVDCHGTAVIHPASLDEAGKWRAPIGTGPFKFNSWQADRYIELVKFGSYSALSSPATGNVGNKTPLVDKVRFEIIPDSTAARTALQSGEIDLLDGVAPSDVTPLKKTSGVTVVSQPLMDVYALLLQTKDPVLANPQMRRAIALSIDVQALARNTTNGTATANSSMVPVSSPYYKGGQRDLIRRDIALAKSLAAASGYRGQTIKLATNKRYPQMFDAAVLIQAMAKEAGIIFEIETFDWATQFDRYADGDYQAMTFAYSARLDPTFNFATVIGRKADEPRKVWDDPVSQALLAKSAAATDDESRQTAFDKLNARMRELTPLVVTYNPPHVIAWRSGISGVKNWPAVQQRLWGVSKKP